MAKRISKSGSSRHRKEWFDNDEFWRDIYPFTFSEQRFAAAADEVEKAIALINPQGTAVLDLCCGPGRCSVPLAERGFSVTGVDRTRFLLTKARSRAKTANVAIEWVCSDMRDFARRSSFDVVLSMFTSFGYFDDKRQDTKVLDNILTSLRDGGVCLIDVMGKERLARILQPTTSDILPDGTVLVQRHEIFDSWTRIRNEWLVLRGSAVKRYKFHHTIYSGRELADQMKQVGFMDVRLYGSLSGEEYGPNSPRLIAVGRKVA